jgi:hypothetical protein
MREMGRLAGVPIEPDEQYRLLNSTSSLPGVIGGGVPGGMHLYCTSSYSQQLISWWLRCGLDSDTGSGWAEPLANRREDMGGVQGADDNAVKELREPGERR